jgi:hypothetical protein
MSSMIRVGSILWAAVLLVPVALSSGCGSAGKPESRAPAPSLLSVEGQLPAKTGIRLTVDAPPDGALVASPPGEITLAGTAEVDAGAVAPGTIVFAVDASQASQAASTEVCDPGDTGKATLLGCEIAAALATNAKADPLKVTQAGVVIFGGGPTTDGATAHADMSGTTGDQPFALPGTGVDTVLRSITVGKVAQYTERTVTSTSTSFAAGLEAAGALAGSGPGKTLVFLANGANGAGPNVSSATFPEGVVVRAFGFGDHGCEDDASGFGSLDAVAARGAPGSTCQRLASLSELPDITTAQVTQLVSLAVTVDGGAPLDITASATPALPLDGPASAQFSYRLVGLTPGPHQVCVRAEGVDSGGTGSVEACLGVTVASITLAPETNVTELGTPGQGHAVVATVAAGSAGGVAGVDVAFDVVSGPNQGLTGSGKTDSSGQASFTYTARQHLEGLGTDTIRACFTDTQGQQACASATQTWQDTTPPVPACLAGPNPGGNVPGSSTDGGPNPSGFYRLVAVDAVDPDPEVFLEDAGSGTVFGPFHSGIAVKYTQAPGGKPGQKAMAGDVAWHITGKGDAQLHARDAVGNVSNAIWCLVPPK